MITTEIKEEVPSALEMSESKNKSHRMMSVTLDAFGGGSVVSLVDMILKKLSIDNLIADECALLVSPDCIVNDINSVKEGDRLTILQATHLPTYLQARSEIDVEK